MWPNDQLLYSLDPSGRDSALWLLAAARSVGLPVIVTSARRSLAKQEALVPGAGLYKASNANLSRHVQGRAFDLGFDGYQWRQVPPEYFRWLGTVWKMAGGRWGGDFSKPDPVHFDW